MFEIIIHYFMQDTVRCITAQPLVVLDSLNMRGVSHIEMTAVRAGD